MTTLDGADRAPIPTALAARTFRVYVAPLVSPVTVPLVAVAEMPVSVMEGPVLGVARIS